ncbi:DM13 domain-containing protein [Flavobacterium terrisoli]|uniref:DM13 domain-containing protein n=1 Tax=Flavobacterium terrisoli TaxID=3242195 RepID=UPI002543095B|nr:DM13 domain-containing protein [Flavobacterium buctense]
MKTILLLFTTVLLFASCESDRDRNNNEPVLKYDGTFVPTTGINVEGDVKIYRQNNTHSLQLEGFSISHGPDLKVYLSKMDTPSDFINLGDLNPNVTYQVPPQVNLADYPYVLIHCQQYNHLYAIAALQTH